jgi:hypothetical protein
VKVIKYLTISISILSFCVILLIIGFILFFDLSKYKTDIENLISEQIDRKVEIVGDLGLSLYPFFSLDIDKIGIYNPSAFEDKYFIKIGKINISLDLVKLIREKVVSIKNISLIQPEFNLITLDNGTDNWMDLIKKIEGNKSKVDQNLNENKRFKSLEIFIDNINVEKGVISVKNYKNKQFITLKNLNIDMNNLGKKEAVQYSFSTDVIFNKNTSSIRANGTLKKGLETISLLNNELKISNIKIEGNQLNNIYCSFSGSLNFRSGVSNIKNINISYDTFKALANIEINSKDGNYSITGNTQLNYVYNNKDLKLSGNIDYQDKKLKLSDLSLIYGTLKSLGSAEIAFTNKIDIKYYINVDKIKVNKLSKKPVKEKKEDHKYSPHDFMSFLAYVDKIKEINIDRFALDGNLSVKQLIIDNRTLNNLTLHTTLEDGQFLNDLKLQHNETLFNTHITFKRNKAGESILNLKAFANMISLKELFKKDIKTFETLNKPSLEFSLMYNRGLLLFKKITFSTIVNDKTFSIILKGNINNNGDISIEALNINFNKSHINFILNSNAIDILKRVRGSFSCNINLGDIAFFTGASEAKNSNNTLAAKADFDIHFKDNRVVFKNGLFTYKNSHLEWNLESNFRRPYILNLSVTADYINVNDIMGLYSVVNTVNNDILENDSSKKNNLNNKKPVANNLKINAELAINKLVFKKLTIDKIKLNGGGENHNYTLDVNALFYNGKLKGLLHINTEEIDPSFGLNGKVAEVTMDKLIVDLVDKPVFTGLGDLDIELQSSGNDINELLNKLNGKIFVNIHKGTLNGLNIGFILRNIFSLIGQDDFAFNRTLQDYSGVKANINVVNGIFYNNDLLIHSPIFRIRGDGLVNVPENYIDYNMYLSLLRPTFDNSSKENSNVLYTDILNKELLIHYKGPIKNPKQNIDYKSYIEKTLGRKLQKEIVPLKKKIDKFIEGLF